MDRRTDPQSDLLYGLIALQNGFIDQGGLFAAFHTWSRDRTRSMAEILEDQGAVNLSRRNILDRLVQEHSRDTETPSEDQPSLEPSTGEEDRTGTEQADPFRTASLPPPSSSESGSRFRTLRHHARGGLGVVYVALDTELNREVALKQILDHHADNPSSRSRFLLEAEITGGLEHPGIVPVYSLGHFEDGRPYYAMRFIRGDTFKDSVARFHANQSFRSDPGARSLAFRDLLRRFLDACNAIEYAHGRGVVHRDLKPSNILVGKHGETLVVDWGLAKAVGRNDETPTDERTLVPISSSGSAETLPGSAIGTPSFMSPEQALGDLDRIGPASDVYSMGATLYVLLTGRVPFEGDVETMLRAVKEGRFASPRSIDSEIPPALEAICLKAMALKPTDRYSSPRALGEDVERWMADEPVNARPEPFEERFRRRMRRHRTAMTAAMVGLLAASIGLASILIVQSQARADLSRKNQELQESVDREKQTNLKLSEANTTLELALRQLSDSISREIHVSNDLREARDRESKIYRELLDAKRRDEERFDLAMKTAKSFLIATGQDSADDSGRESLKERVFTVAEGLYEQMAAQLLKETDQGSRRRLAKVRYDQGELQAGKGNFEKALEFQQVSLELRTRLVAEEGAEKEVAYEITRNQTAIGLLLEKSGKYDKAKGNYEEARRKLDELVRSDPRSIPYQSRLADCHEYIGRVLWSDFQAKTSVPVPQGSGARVAQQPEPKRGPDQLNEAVLAFQRAREIRESLTKEERSTPTLPMDLLRTYEWIGFLLTRAERYAEAILYLEKTRTIREAMIKNDPLNSKLRDQWRRSLEGIAFALEKSGRKADAVQVREKLGTAKSPPMERTLPMVGTGAPAMGMGMATGSLITGLFETGGWGLVLPNVIGD
jgi:eukaryotic-like serine/threonine-protein kinase